MKINENLVELYHRQKIMWRQRDIIEWLSAGDKNTFFIHQRANKRRRRNLIKSLAASNGLTIEDPLLLEAMATDFYSSLFQSEGVTDIHKVIVCVPVKVTDAMNEVLTATYTRDEVKTALFRMFPQKAPRPDGFPAQFFNIIGRSMVMMWQMQFFVLSGDWTALKWLMPPS